MRARWLIQRQERVRRVAREEAPGLLALEHAFGQALGVPQGL